MDEPPPSDGPADCGLRLPPVVSARGFLSRSNSFERSGRLIEIGRAGGPDRNMLVCQSAAIISSLKQQHSSGAEREGQLKLTLELELTKRTNEWLSHLAEPVMRTADLADCGRRRRGAIPVWLRKFLGRAGGGRQGVRQAVAGSGQRVPGQ
eukprot:SAG22_NODE_3396_length_1734_cov_1.993272_1_plen_151_part_00